MEDTENISASQDGMTEIIPSQEEETSTSNEAVVDEKTESENASPEVESSEAKVMPTDTAAPQCAETDSTTSTDQPAEEAPSAASTDPLTKILSAVNRLAGRVDDLEKRFDARIMHTDSEEKVIDRMHDELQKYKGDMYSQLLRPVLLDIIDMRDSIQRMAEVYEKKPEQEQAIPLSSFSTYADDIEEILTKNNISIYRTEEGEAFSAAKQRVVKKVPTPVEELQGKVAEIASDGYEYMGKVIAPEKVAVYVYQAPEKAEGGESSNG